MTTIAVPNLNGYVSPVFDTARELLLVEKEGERELSRRQMTLDQRLPLQRAVWLGGLGVDVLICGAISRELALLLDGQGVAVIPFVSGGVDEVLSAYTAHQLADPRFLMPGCGRGRFGFCRSRGPRSGRPGGRGRSGAWR